MHPDPSIAFVADSARPYAPPQSLSIDAYALGTETARSRPTVVVMRAPEAPSNVRPPTVRYSGEVGSLRFTAHPGIWRGTPKPRLTFQWQYCGDSECVDITGAHGRTYAPKEGQGSCDIRVVVTATNGAGSSSAMSRRVRSCVD